MRKRVRMALAVVVTAALSTALTYIYIISQATARAVAVPAEQPPMSVSQVVLSAAAVLVVGLSFAKVMYEDGGRDE